MMKSSESQKDDQLVRQGEAAKILATTESFLAQRRYRGQPPKFVKVGRCVRYRLSDLNEFVESQVRVSTGDPGPSGR